MDRARWSSLVAVLSPSGLLGAWLAPSAVRRLGLVTALRLWNDGEETLGALGLPCGRGGNQADFLNFGYFLGLDHSGGKQTVCFFVANAFRK